MNFQSLANYIKKNGCNFHHLVGNSYLAINTIAEVECIIEKLPSYGSVTLCHYFRQLEIPITIKLMEYDDFLDDIEDKSLLTKGGQEASEKAYQFNRSRGVTR